MRKHSPDLVPTPPTVGQQSHSPAHGGGAGGGSAGGADGAAASRGERTNPYPQPEGVPCVFDLQQYKPVTAPDVSYKTVSVSDLSAHKDLCITVEASAIQVEHLSSWGRRGLWEEKSEHRLYKQTWCSRKESSVTWFYVTSPGMRGLPKVGIKSKRKDRLNERYADGKEFPTRPAQVHGNKNSHGQNEILRKCLFLSFLLFFFLLFFKTSWFLTDIPLFLVPIYG